MGRSERPYDRTECDLAHQPPRKAPTPPVGVFRMSIRTLTPDDDYHASEGHPEGTAPHLPIGHSASGMRVFSIMKHPQIEQRVERSR